MTDNSMRMVVSSEYKELEKFPETTAKATDLVVVYNKVRVEGQGDKLFFSPQWFCTDIQGPKRGLYSPGIGPGNQPRVFELLEDMVTYGKFAIDNLTERTQRNVYLLNLRGKIMTVQDQHPFKK